MTRARYTVIRQELELELLETLLKVALGQTTSSHAPAFPSVKKASAPGQQEGVTHGCTLFSASQESEVQ